MPFCLTWEQFVPPHSLSPGHLHGIVERAMLKVTPIGEGDPLHVEPYRVHLGRYSSNEEHNEVLEQRQDFAVVITCVGETVGVLSGLNLWVHVAHRRGRCGIDIAAELWAAHAVRRGIERDFAYLKGKKISMTRESYKVSKRAYALLVERGVLSMPEGYVVPETP